MEDKSVLDLLKLRKPIRNPYKLHKEQRTVAERFSIFIANKVGTVGFFLIIIIWSIAWFAWNTFGPIEFRFDPFPVFEIWVFTANVIQLSLMPLILFGQRIQEKANEVKSNEEYELDLRTERELAQVLLMLEEQKKMLESLEKRIK